MVRTLICPLFVLNFSGKISPYISHQILEIKAQFNQRRCSPLPPTMARESERIPISNGEPVNGKMLLVLIRASPLFAKVRSVFYLHSSQKLTLGHFPPLFSQLFQHPWPLHRLLLPTAVPKRLQLPCHLRLFLLLHPQLPTAAPQQLQLVL